MNLSFDEIKSIVFGSVCTTNEADGIHFCKMTAEQLAVWDGQSADLGRNARALTGVTLDFETNSKTVFLELSEECNLDVYLNGLPYRHRTLACIMKLRLNGQRNRVTIYLPAHDTPPAIVQLSVDDGAFVEPHHFDRKFLFMGDSITQGWDSVFMGERFDSMSYANIVSRHFNAESVICGVGGAYFLPESLTEMPFDPDTVIVAYGTNDYFRFSDHDFVLKNAEEYLTRAADLYWGKRLFCITPIYRDVGPQEQPKFDEYCERLKEVVRRSAFTLIDGGELVPHYSDYYADKNLHPNALGFYIYGKNLIREMEKAFGQQDS